MSRFLETRSTELAISFYRTNCWLNSLEWFLVDATHKEAAPGLRLCYLHPSADDLSENCTKHVWD